LKWKILILENDSGRQRKKLIKQSTVYNNLQIKKWFIIQLHRDTMDIM